MTRQICADVRTRHTKLSASRHSKSHLKKKGTPASPATARASSVLPVPGGPVRRTPLGSLAPRRVNFAGFFRYSTRSSSSPLASSHPFTSLKLFTDFSGSSVCTQITVRLVASILISLELKASALIADSMQIPCLRSCCWMPHSLWDNFTEAEDS